MTDPHRPLAKTGENPELDRMGLQGLAAELADSRLRDEGLNELPSQRPRTTLIIMGEVIREPMFLMLLLAGLLYGFMGEPVDAAVLFVALTMVIGITVIQERRTERALDALRDLSSPRARVIRDGIARRIAGREVVRGDIVILAEGDRVPADGILRRGINLVVDEALLTGESMAVRKRPSATADTLDPPGGDDLSSVFSGTLVTAGQGIFEVLATGAHSQLGHIGRSLQTLTPEPTSLQRETRRLVRVVAAIALLACAIVVLAFAISRGGSAADWQQAVLAGITMAMALLPEEFPVVLTVFLALGAWRISRAGVLTRRNPAIEMLGAATVLCVDKTGTLTQNQMTLRRLDTGVDTLDLATAAAADVAPSPSGSAHSDSLHTLLEYAVLASKQDPFDPMEQALVRAGDVWLQPNHTMRATWSLVREYPLSPSLLAVSHAWRGEDGQPAILASKGAPEAIFELCRLSAPERARYAQRVAALAARGLRVLGVARGRLACHELPENHHDLPMEFVGLLGLEDPLRHDVPEAVACCHTAKIRVVMITGDYPITAQAIARQAGLHNTDYVLTGQELEQMSDETLATAIRQIDIFARVVPAQKLRIVQALKAANEIVAMTGDGVNDAPALKAAHIGIAMGGRGTDVAREAASLVLLHDDFASIVGSIRLGRRIYANIKKAVSFIVAVHVPILGLSMFPVFAANWPLLLLPVHVAFLELVIDPACTLIYEAESPEHGVMRQAPRRPDERLFSQRMLLTALLQGGLVLAASIGVFLWAYDGHSVPAARSLTFATLVLSALVIILVNRSLEQSSWTMLKVPNSSFRWVVGGTITTLALVLFVPPLQPLFHFGDIRVGEVMLAAAAAALCLVCFELAKWMARRRSSHAGSLDG